MHRLLILSLLLLITGWGFSGKAIAAQPVDGQVLFIANETVLPGMLTELRRLGQQRDVVIQTARTRDIQGAAPWLTKQAPELVIIFAPSHELVFTEGLIELRTAIEAARIPMLIIHRDQLEISDLAMA